VSARPSCAPGKINKRALREQVAQDLQLTTSAP
jgi:hypothetical protein